MTKTYKKNPQIRLDTKVSKDTARKIDAYTKRHNITKREFIEIATINLIEQDNYTNGV